MELVYHSKLTDSIPLCFIKGNKLLFSRSNNIFLLDTLTGQKRHITQLPASPWLRMANASKLISRVLRLGVRYAIPLPNDKVLVVFNLKFYEVDLKTGAFKETFTLPRGNRPLDISHISSISGFEDRICFGEYFYNPEKTPVHIYSKRLEDPEWEISYTFKEGEIDHVHAIVPDPYRNCVWILTGDFDGGSAIWMAKDNFREVRPVLRGKQIYRACVAFPVKEGLIYATDSQFEINSIRLLKAINNTEWTSDFLYEINGPAIYGCKVDETLFFSTSVEGNSIPKGKILRYLDREPGPGVKDNYSYIVGGNMSSGFTDLSSNEKDRYPLMIFQFGAITFPSGRNETNMLVTYNRSLKRNGFDTEIFTIKLQL
ncbi:hypothetical protein [Pedobacter frigoris]|uniref:hypothetical protein n=1 Tax=Pedobacter frigoris TaxID=2571272 RepID=UPI00293122FE|nr:hypothetical protein [Pedobacter frigoris]